MITGFILIGALSTPVMANHFSGPFIGAHVGGAVTIDKYNANLTTLPNPPVIAGLHAFTLYDNNFQLSQTIPINKDKGGTLQPQFENRIEISTVNSETQHNFLVGVNARYDV